MMEIKKVRKEQTAEHTTYSSRNFSFWGREFQIRYLHIVTGVERNPQHSLPIEMSNDFRELFTTFVLSCIFFTNVWHFFFLFSNTWETNASSTFFMDL